MAEQTNGVHTNGTTSLASDLFADMGRQVNAMSNPSSLEADEDQKVVDEISSLCMNCHETGTTRLLLTRIPFFREVVIMSFSCPHCHFSNNEIQSAGEIQPRGSRFSLRVDDASDLARGVVKSDAAVMRLETLDLEIPSGKGRYTNVEGVIAGVRADLETHQEERERQMPETAAQVAEVISKLRAMENGETFPFMVSVDDPSGNSSIEPRPGDGAGKWAKSEYNRTPEQNSALGLGDEGAPPPQEQRPEYRATSMIGADPLPLPNGNNVDAQPDPSGEDAEIIENQVYSFPASCPGCTRPCATNMKMVNIPYFAQVVLMSTVCDSCGYRSNEVKTGGEVPAKGKRITLRVRNPEDLGRDILKSESAALACPELQLRVEPGTMGGRFTTVEGILTQIRRDLRGQAFGLEDGDGDAETRSGGGGDSMAEGSRGMWEAFFGELTEAIEGRKEFTLVLEDPLAGSYVQSFTAPEPDPQILVEDYERTEEEEEDLGLRDIRTEGYEQEEEGNGEVNGS